jgi:hypothetical protein
MKILTTSDLYYITGGDDGGGSDSSGGDSSDSSDSTTCAATGDKSWCIDYCSRLLPSGNNGFSFWNCMNSCYSPFRTGSNTSYGVFEDFA